ncbi:hypothetical protein Aut01nite_85960 [Actinoplanes utahensis]|nr:hypothetical protein Aut01nite_85960 [Actinoplanes utahensis]
MRGGERGQQSGVDDGSGLDIRRRAERRMRLMVALVVGSAIVAVLAGFLTASGEVSAGVVALVTGAVVVGVAIPAGWGFWLVKRRTGAAVSPLWGASRQVRARVIRAIRTGEELPPGERELAVAEATRLHRLGWAPVAGFGIAGLLFAAQVVLRAADRDPAWQILSVALAASCFTLLAAHHLYFYRRSRRYLRLFG